MDIEEMVNNLMSDEDRAMQAELNDGDGDEVPFEKEIDRLKVEMKKAVELGADIMECFEHFDTDRSGDVDVDEFRLGMERLNIVIDRRSAFTIIKHFSEKRRKKDERKQRRLARQQERQLQELGQTHQGPQGQRHTSQNHEAPPPPSQASSDARSVGAPTEPMDQASSVGGSSVEMVEAEEGPSMYYRDFVKAMDLLERDENEPDSSDDEDSVDSHGNPKERGSGERGGDSERQGGAEHGPSNDIFEDGSRGCFGSRKGRGGGKISSLVTAEDLMAPNCPYVVPVTVTPAEIGQAVTGNEATVMVIHPCSVGTVKQKLVSKVDMPAIQQRIVWKGQILQDFETIPDECFNTEPDEHGYVAQLWITKAEVDPEVLEGASATGKKKDQRVLGDMPSSDEESDGDSVLSGASSTGARLRKKQDKANKAFNKVLKKQQAFDLYSELAAIKCEQHAAALEERGFNEKNAFFNVQDEELAGPGLWICKRARRRIMALAEMYRRDDEMKEAKRQTAIDEVNELMKSTKTFTVDGEHFYPSLRELDAVWKQAHAYNENLEREREEERLAAVLELRQHEDTMRMGVSEADDTTKGGAMGFTDSKAGPTKKKLDPKDRLAAAMMDTGPREDPTTAHARLISRYLRAKKRLTARPGETGPVRQRKVEVLRLIREVRHKSNHDEYGIPAHYFSEEHSYCCGKHSINVGKSFSKYMRSLGGEIRAWVRKELIDADPLGINYVPKEVLVDLSKEVLLEYGIEPTEMLLDEIFQACELPEDRPFYNYNKFERVIGDLIDAEEAKRLSRLRDAKVAPVTKGKR